MATIAVLIGGAILNATAFVGGNYLAKSLSGNSAALDEKERHDKALEKFQRDHEEWYQRRKKFQDWLEESHERQSKARQDLTNTDMALKLYASVAEERERREASIGREPRFGDYYKPSDSQKKAEIAYVGAGALAIGYAASRFV